MNSPTSNLDPFACLHAQAKACSDSLIAVDCAGLFDPVLPNPMAVNTVVL